MYHKLQSFQEKSGAPPLQCICTKLSSLHQTG